MGSSHHHHHHSQDPMRLYEYEAKNIFKKYGIPVPEHVFASSPEEAKEIAEEIGEPVVIKAQVLVGKRGKAGGIKFANTPEEAREVAEELLGMTIRGHKVEKVLVEEKIDIAKEFYVSITIDGSNKQPVIIFSTEGGVDIEEVAKKHPEKIVTYHIDPLIGLPPYQAREIIAKLGLTGELLRKLADILVKLYKVFVEYDATLLEINPLVITPDGKFVAADAVMNIDDDAMYRHPDLRAEMRERMGRPLTQRELEARMIEANDYDHRGVAGSYTELDGDIGLMSGGGGGSMVTMDALISYGGKPANYTEIGGNPPAEKVYKLTKVILSKPGVKAIFVVNNIANNTRVDVMARGIVKALKEMGIDPKVFPIVVRMAGTNEEEGRKILREAGIEYYGAEMSMTEAAKRMVEKMKEVSANR